MKTLVLNVDRDDDFGRKAKVKSPIIGIKNNFDAANKLGQADPEDSDLNAIFSAIATYNSLKEEKKDVEIATICGNIRVGIKSDEILANQLEEVIKTTNADNVILITDGAEDEYILPIIQSRIKINSVQRVSVKQSRELEDTYYRILKILDDEKVLKQFVLPIALVLIVWAFFALIGMAASGFGAILLTLGAYLLIRCFKWEKNVAAGWNEVKSGFLTGKLSIYTYILAVIILIAFGLFAYYNTDFTSNTEFLPIINFISIMIPGFVIAGLIAVFGRAVDIYVKDKKTPSTYLIAPFSLFAFGFISYAIFGAFGKALTDTSFFNIEPFLEADFLGFTFTGIMIALIGAIVYHYIKESRQTEEKELEIEEQTSKMIEKN
jgi:putative membrane protein